MLACNRNSLRFGFELTLRVLQRGCLEKKMAQKFSRPKPQRLSKIFDFMQNGLSTNKKRNARRPYIRHCDAHNHQNYELRFGGAELWLDGDFYRPYWIPAAQAPVCLTRPTPSPPTHIPQRADREFEIALSVVFRFRQAAAGDIHLQRMQNEFRHRQSPVPRLA